MSDTPTAICGSPSPQLLRRLYLLAQLGCTDFDSPPSTHANGSGFESWLVDQSFALAEQRLGFASVARFVRVLCAARDGLSEPDLEDLLSMDAGVLADSTRWNDTQQRLLGKARGAIGSPPVRRAPPILVAALLAVLGTDLELVHVVQAGSPHLPVVRFVGAAARTAAERLYASDARTAASTRSDLASHLLGHGEWSKISAASTLGARLLPVRPLRFPASGSGVEGFDLRLTRELLPALAGAQRWTEILRLLETFPFVEAFVMSEGIEGAILRLNSLVRDCRRSGMQADNGLMLRHLTTFLRQRSRWASYLDAGEALQPPGLWLQEFLNFPTASNARFAEGMRSGIEENWDDYLTPRGGRLEYEASWVPETDPYVSTAFRHVAVQSCSVSADSRLLATGAEDGSVRVWNLHTGELFNNISTSLDSLATPVRAGVTALAFSGERPAQFLATCNHDPGQEPDIWLVPVRSATLPSTTAPGLAVGSTAATAARRMSGTAHSAGAAIARCEFVGPDFRRLLTVGSDFRAVVWEVARCRVVRVLPFPSAGPLSELLPHPAPVGEVPVALPAVASGWRRVAGAVSGNGLLAFGSTALTVVDGRWREVLVREVAPVAGFGAGRRALLACAAFSHDSVLVFGGAAVPPDEAQELAVLRQRHAERVLSRLGSGSAAAVADLGEDGWEEDDGHPGRDGRGGRQAGVNDVASSVEADLRRARIATVRGWNLQTGHLVFHAVVDDYLTALATSLDGDLVLAAGASGAISGWDVKSGLLAVSHVSHTRGIAQMAVVPLPALAARSRRRSSSTTGDWDDSALASYDLPFQPVSSRSLASGGGGGGGGGAGPTSMGGSCPSLHLVTVAPGDFAVLWDLGVSDGFRLSPMSACRFSPGADALVTVGGGGPDPKTTDHACRPNSLVRLWDTASGMQRWRFELPETLQTEIVDAVFLPAGHSGSEERILIGCRNGAVRIHRLKGGELLREFWADVELALGEATLGRRMEWPFAVAGTAVVSYALHPGGQVLAVAVAGHERTASAARIPGRQVLRSLVRVTFWDLEGNPLATDGAFAFPIEFEAADASCAVGPVGRLPRTAAVRWRRFALRWSPTGQALFATDGREVVRECSVTLDGERAGGGIVVTGGVESRSVAKVVAPLARDVTAPGGLWRKWWPARGSSLAPELVAAGSGGDGKTGDPAQLGPSVMLELSAATAVSVAVERGVEYLCFALADGVVGLRVRSLRSSSMGDVAWFPAHARICSSAGAELVACEFVPHVAGRPGGVSGGGGVPNMIPGVIVSASSDGTIILQ
ncbi:hypothetical protein HK405_002806, partial [Cladochytrium tenue]